MHTLPRWRHTLPMASMLVLAMTQLTPAALSEDGVATLGSPPPDEAAPETVVVHDPMDALLEFAACMREHGVDMQDPKPGGGGGYFIVEEPGAGDGSFALDTDFATAEEACREHLDAVAAPEHDPIQEAETMERLLAHAECLREQGLDMPDPVIDDHGIRFGPAVDTTGDALDPFSPMFQEAQDACRDTSPFGAGGDWSTAP